TNPTTVNAARARPSALRDLLPFTFVHLLPAKGRCRMGPGRRSSTVPRGFLPPSPTFLCACTTRFHAKPGPTRTGPAGKSDRGAFLPGAGPNQDAVGAGVRRAR